MKEKLWERLVFLFMIGMIGGFSVAELEFVLLDLNFPKLLVLVIGAILICIVVKVGERYIKTKIIPLVVE